MDTTLKTNKNLPGTVDIIIGSLILMTVLLTDINNDNSTSIIMKAIMGVSVIGFGIYCIKKQNIWLAIAILDVIAGIALLLWGSASPMSPLWLFTCATGITSIIGGIFCVKKKARMTIIGSIGAIAGAVMAALVALILSWSVVVSITAVAGAGLAGLAALILVRKFRMEFQR